LPVLKVVITIDSFAGFDGKAMAIDVGGNGYIVESGKQTGCTMRLACNSNAI